MSDKYEEVAQRITHEVGWEDNEEEISAILRESFPAPVEGDEKALREAADRAVAWHGYDASEREQKEYNPDYTPIWEQGLRSAIMRPEPRGEEPQ